MFRRILSETEKKEKLILVFVAIVGLIGGGVGFLVNYISKESIYSASNVQFQSKAFEKYIESANLFCESIFPKYQRERWSYEKTSDSSGVEVSILEPGKFTFSQMPNFEDNRDFISSAEILSSVPLSSKMNRDELLSPFIVHWRDRKSLIFDTFSKNKENSIIDPNNFFCAVV